MRKSGSFAFREASCSATLSELIAPPTAVVPKPAKAPAVLTAPVTVCFAAAKGLLLVKISSFTFPSCLPASLNASAWVVNVEGKLLFTSLLAEFLSLNSLYSGIWPEWRSVLGAAVPPVGAAPPDPEPEPDVLAAAEGVALGVGAVLVVPLTFMIILIDW